MNVNVMSLVYMPYDHVPSELTEDTFSEINTECLRWLKTHGLIDDRATRELFAHANPAPLAASGYPRSPVERLRPIVDCFAWIFLWDDVHADNTSDHEGAAAAVADVLDVLDGNDPVDGWSAALAECFGRVCDSLPAHRHARIATAFREYMLGVALQHATRPTDVKMVRTARNYITVGSLMVAVIEPALGLNVPVYEYDDPDVKGMIWHISHHIGLVNDVASAVFEQHESNAWNTAIAYASAHGSSLDAGMADAARRATEHVSEFECIAHRRLAADRAPTDDLVRFVDGMRALAAGHFNWMSTSPRYG